MPRIRHPDNPDYAVDVIDGAKPIGSQLSVAAGLLSMLLAAMTTMETPVQPHDPVANGAGATEVSEPSVSGPGPLCLIGEKVKDWNGVTAS
jgi:hypothetical protein